MWLWNEQKCKSLWKIIHFTCLHCPTFIKTSSTGTASCTSSADVMLWSYVIYNLSTNTQLTRASNISRQVKRAMHTAHMLSSAISPGGTDGYVQMYNTDKIWNRARRKPPRHGRHRQAILLFTHKQKCEQIPTPSVGHNRLLYRILYFLRSLKKHDTMSTHDSWFSVKCLSFIKGKIHQGCVANSWLWKLWVE